MKPGDLVQVKRGIQGQGDIGIILGPVKSPMWSRDLIEVMFYDGIRECHPVNLQEPDGRTRRKQ